MNRKLETVKQRVIRRKEMIENLYYLNTKNDTKLLFLKTGLKNLDLNNDSMYLEMKFNKLLKNVETEIVYPEITIPHYTIVDKESSFKDLITDSDIDILFEEIKYPITKLSTEEELTNLKFITTDETFNEILRFINEDETNVVIIKK